MATRGLGAFLELRVSSQHPHSGSRLCITSVPGNLMPSLLASEGGINRAQYVANTGVQAKHPYTLNRGGRKKSWVRDGQGCIYRSYRGPGLSSQLPTPGSQLPVTQLWGLWPPLAPAFVCMLLLLIIFNLKKRNGTKNSRTSKPISRGI